MAVRRAALWLLVGLLAGCHSSRPWSYYEGHYFGVLNYGVLNYFSRARAACREQALIQAMVFNNTFTLSLQGHRLDGTLTSDGKLTAQGRWTQDQHTVEGHFTGSIAGPMFGKLFSGTIEDGVCNPYIELSQVRLPNR